MLAVVFAIAVQELTPAGRADVSGITVVTNPPILGAAVTCTAKDDGHNPTVARWQWAVNGTPPPGIGNSYWGVAVMGRGDTISFLRSCSRHLRRE